MSFEMDQAADAILQAARQEGSSNDLSDAEIDGSSCLSYIEDKEAEGKEKVPKDEEAEVSDEPSNTSEDENDSEAETERLEESSLKYRASQHVVLNSANKDTYDQIPSISHNQNLPDGRYSLSDEDNSIDESPDSPKSSAQDEAEEETSTVSTSLDDSTGESKKPISIVSADTRKRKRSIMGGTALNDLSEPLRKRTGSILTPGDDFAIEVNTNQRENNSNSITCNASGDEGGIAQEDEIAEDTEEPVARNIFVSPMPASSISSRRRECKKKTKEPKIIIHDVNPEKHDNLTVADGAGAKSSQSDVVGNEEEDETEAALRNEEELEKKRTALHQLVDIERQFSAFRDRLYEERLEQLTCEEAVLRQAQPSHPGYLAMLRCIDARRDDKMRIADRLREYELESLKKVAVAQRSQILIQYQQEVRDVREKKLEQLGEQWYKIQHDRRSYAGASPEYVLKFPMKKSQQISNHIAYSSEVSILSGIAKYVGFPAAPIMAPATATELEEDLEKMGELTALRAENPTSRIRPAEEQFIEQTPWANPQHPLHAHLINRHISTSQIPQAAGPISQGQVPPRRQSHQNGGCPSSGTFSNPSLMQQLSAAGGRVSPHNPFGNSSFTSKGSPDIPISTSKSGSCKSFRSTTSFIENTSHS